MFQRPFYILAILICTLTGLSSCESETPATPKNVKYEITGNFSGELQVIYFQANGGAGSEPGITLPWTKNVSYDASVASISLSLAGSGGVSGQTLTANIYRNDEQVRTVSAIANGDGVISATTNPYTF